MNDDLLELPPFVADPHGRVALKIAAAQGCFLIAPSGNRYLDLTSGWNVANLGWQHPAIVQAVIRQIQSLPLSPAWCTHDPAIALSQELATLVPRDLAVLRAPTGAQAIEFAIRIARVATGRYPIVSIAECYHGSTHGALLASGIDYLRDGRATAHPGNTNRVLPLPTADDSNLEAVRNIVSAEPRPAAVLLEPMLTNAGAIVGSPDYFAAIVETARQHDVLVIADEVGTGLGRMGSLLGSQWYNLAPDLIVLGKSLGGGVAPMAAVLMARELASSVRGLAFDSTFAGTPAGCSAGLATLEILKRADFLEQVRCLGDEALRKLRADLNGHAATRSIRGKGLLLGIEFQAETRAEQLKFVTAVVSGLHAKGIFAAHSRYSNALLVMPPLNIEAAVLNNALATIAEVVEETHFDRARHG